VPKKKKKKKIAEGLNKNIRSKILKGKKMLSHFELGSAACN
jgi:hypothetical protein